METLDLVRRRLALLATPGESIDVPDEFIHRALHCAARLIDPCLAKETGAELARRLHRTQAAARARAHVAAYLIMGAVRFRQGRYGEAKEAIRVARTAASLACLQLLKLYERTRGKWAPRPSASSPRWLVTSTSRFRFRGKHH